MSNEVIGATPMITTGTVALPENAMTISNCESRGPTSAFWRGGFRKKTAVQNLPAHFAAPEPAAAKM
jgi:hypothetical protein